MFAKIKNFDLFFLVGLLLAIATSTQLYLEIEDLRPVNGSNLFLAQFLKWQFWAIAAPVVGWFGRRFRLERGSWLSGLAIHISLSVLISVLHVAFSVFISRAFPMMPDRRQFSFFQFFLNLSYTYHIELLTYWGILGATYAFEYYQKYRERELQASQLTAQLAQANLKALKMQLHPHFLFNTLNAAVSLVRKNENKAAVKMLVGISELLRHVLDNTGKQEIPLKEELELIERYLEIQQTRFSDRLKVIFTIPHETLNALVPNLVLQPIVENAIQHGISPKAEGGRIEITAVPEQETLRLTVFNDGYDLPVDSDSGKASGLGISNTSERLKQLYGENQFLEIKNAEQGGVIVIICLPLRFAQEKSDEKNTNSYR